MEKTITLKGATTLSAFHYGALKTITLCAGERVSYDRQPYADGTIVHTVSVKINGIKYSASKNTLESGRNINNTQFPGLMINN